MLTREEILALPDGKHLNAAIAEHVLGHIWLYNKRYSVLVAADEATIVVEGGHAFYGKHPEHEAGCWIDPLDSYSTDMAAAWLVVQAMAPTHDLSLRTKWRRAETGPMQKVGIRAQFDPKGTISGFADPLADTAPIAICRAALLACLDAAALSIDKETSAAG